MLILKLSDITAALWNTSCKSTVLFLKYTSFDQYKSAKEIVYFMDKKSWRNPKKLSFVYFKELSIFKNSTDFVKENTVKI